MKKTITSAGFAIALLALLSFSSPGTASIKGKVTPESYASNAWAISKTDTLYTTVNNGAFEFDNVKPGVYRLIIGAESPYANLAKNDVVVRASENTDVGKISLKKYVVVFQ